MSKRISKKVREDAALICAIAASGGVHLEQCGRRSRVYAEIVRELGDALERGLSLAVHAYAELRNVYPNWPVELDAEAEALIRTGWSP